jgi:O-acetyl-ADP-ribose deacetylase (regulator of RNase III)
VAQPVLKTRIEVIEGDITRERMHAIVAVTRGPSVWASDDAPEDGTGAGIMAVLRELSSDGGGADAAIRLAGGPALAEELRLLGHVAEGDAKATGAGALAARHLIHTAAPVWRGGTSLERQKLAWCYRSSLELARSLGCTTVAIPPLGIGASRFPIDVATEIGVAELQRTLVRLPSIRRLRLVCPAPWIVSAFTERLDPATATGGD